MGKAKKMKKGDTLTAEAKERLERAAAAFREGLPSDDPAGLFEAQRLGLAGLETELIETLSRTRTGDMLNFLHQLHLEIEDKALQKAIKKAMYRLEQAGLTVEERYRRKEAPLLKAPEPKPHKGYLGWFDTSGTRMCIFALPNPLGGYDAAVFLDNLADGLVDFQVYSPSAGELRRLLKSFLEDQEAGPLVEVPPEAARFTLAQAAAKAGRLGWRPPDEYNTFTRQASVVPLPEKPFIYNQVTEEEAAGVDLEKWAGPLLGHDLLDGFLLIPELDPVLAKMGEVDDSVLVLTDLQKAERRVDLVAQAAREIFTPERRRAFKGAFEDSAFLLWVSGEKDLARAA
ncbi:MAG: hypothetical protein AB1896_19905, partial [Thermodesulfobacteriota bacterium]